MSAQNEHRQADVPVLVPQDLRFYYNVSSDLFASPEVSQVLLHLSTLSLRILTCRTSMYQQQQQPTSQGIISFNDVFSPKALQVRPVIDLIGRERP